MIAIATACAVFLAMLLERVRARGFG
jgi:hypothetical protein